MKKFSRAVEILSKEQSSSQNNLRLWLPAFINLGKIYHLPGKYTQKKQVSLY